jgi:hypothetical protein
MSASVATMRVAPDALKQAVYARRDHFLANVATLTMKQARRLIEADLGLDAKALDEASTKAAVAQYVDLVLAAGDGPSEKPSAASKENRAPAATAKAAKPVLKPAREGADEEEEEDADSDEEEEDADSDEDSDGSDDSDSEPPSTKKKRHAKVPKVASKRKKAKRTKVSSAAAPVAGAVAALREVCKRAGLTYQHVFMRHKEDEARIEALKSILRDNGLDANASEKAVAKVRAKVELERDLDGIDASNVIEGGRRRRAVATDQWGQATKYAEDAGDDDDTSDEEDETSDEEDDASDDDDDAEKASDDDDEAEKADSEVEPADVFFDDDDGDANDAVDDTEAANELKASKAPRRGGALYSDSDEE